MHYINKLSKFYSLARSNTENYVEKDLYDLNDAYVKCSEISNSYKICLSFLKNL